MQHKYMPKSFNYITILNIFIFKFGSSRKMAYICQQINNFRALRSWDGVYFFNLKQ